jgi:hypothetical protein
MFIPMWLLLVILFCLPAILNGNSSPTDNDDPFKDNDGF